MLKLCQALIFVGDLHAFLAGFDSICSAWGKFGIKMKSFYEKNIILKKPSTDSKP